MKSPKLKLLIASVLLGLLFTPRVLPNHLISLRLMFLVPAAPAGSPRQPQPSGSIPQATSSAGIPTLAAKPTPFCGH